jgi:glycerol-3-phosphate acyltransferase PlsY
MQDLLHDFGRNWPFYAGASAAYLLGTIPFGLVLTRLAGLGDIRAIGSGNIGATNVLRTGRKGLAALTVFLDSGKGFLAVALGGLCSPEMAVFAGAGVVIGHMFPVWLGFKGGKGVAAAGGVLLALSWKLGLAIAATWLIMAFAFGYSSLAALTAALLAPLFAALLTSDLDTRLAALLAVMIIIRHRSNIQRLLRGEESKISLGSKNR